MKEPQSQANSRDNSSGAKVVLPSQQQDLDALKHVAPLPGLAIRFDRLPGGVRQRLGAVLLAMVIAIVIVATAWPGPDSAGLTVVQGYGGELKANFFADEAVAEILAERYGLQVDITVRGSVELACGMPLGEDVDFVWLGDSVALEKYRDLGCTMLRADNVYNSPIVIYSWAPVVDALVTAGVAHVTADGAYTLDFARLVDLMMTGTTWTGIGLTDLHGGIIVQSTDPNRSNSGLLYSGLLANTLNGGPVVNTTTVMPLLPDIQAYFERLGLMESTSGNLFEQFLITGMGAKPMVALYESQIQEFLANNPEYEEQIAQQVRVIYPQPTVWATHPFVVRNDDADRLLTALKDPDLQRLAWEEHGQRPGVPGVEIDPDAIPVPGILPEITSVTSMPSLDTMNLILDAIGGTLPDSTPIASTSPRAPMGALAFIGRAAWRATRLPRRSPDRRRTMPAMRTFNIVLRRLSPFLIVLGMLSPGAALARGTDTPVNVVVGWTAPFEEQTEYLGVPGASYEMVLGADDDTVVVVNGDIDPAPARLDILDALNADTGTIVSVDAGTSGDPQYWLDLFTVDDTPYGAFTLARDVENGVTLSMFLGPVDTFAAGMTQAQSSVLVDGAPLFDGVEPSGLQALLETALPNLDAGDNAGEEEDTPAAGEDSGESDAFADQPGMVAEGEYESPHHGVTLTWTDAWTFDSLWDAPVASNVNQDIDEVHLTVDSRLWAWFGFYAFPLLPGDSFADLVEISSSAERLEMDIGPSAELVDSRTAINADGKAVGALVIRVNLEGYDFLVYEEYRLSGNGESVSVLQLLMYVDDADAGLDAVDSLAFEDGPVITLFTEEELLTAARNASLL